MLFINSKYSSWKNEQKNSNNFALSNVFDKSLAEWLVILICVGYPIQILPVLLFNANSTTVNTSFRVIYLIISIYLLIKRLPEFKSFFSRVFLGYIIFWIFYGIKVIYSLEIENLLFLNKTKFYVYSWAFGICFFPSLAILLNARFLDFSKIAKYLFIILLTSNILILAYYLIFSKSDFLGLFQAQQIDITIKSNTSVRYLLNSITISFYGELLCLFALIYFLFYKNIKTCIKNRISYYLLFSFSFIIGLLNLIAGAARGPLISFILIIIIISITFLIVKIRNIFVKRNNVLNNSIYIIVFITILILIFFVTVLLIQNNFTIARRVQWLFDKPFIEMNDRWLLWENGFKQFMQKPLFGDSFILRKEGTYPHNIIIESLMSTGLIGSVFLFSYISASFYYFYYYNKYEIENLIVFMTLLAFFLISNTSGGLFTQPEFWIITSLINGKWAKSKLSK